MVTAPARLILVLICVQWLLPAGRSEAQTTPVFNDSAADSLTVSTPGYAVMFSKTDGALLSLSDRAGGGTLAVHSNGDCLWGSSFNGAIDSEGDRFIGGCGFASGASSSFTYVWTGNALIMSYASPDLRVNAAATITFRDSSFDMQLNVHNNTAAIISNVGWPDLRVPVAPVRTGYLPITLPGVRLHSSFFSRIYNMAPTYPGALMFADYAALDFVGGRFTIYTVNPDSNPLAPVALGFVHNDSGSCNGPEFCLLHTFSTWIPSLATWTSPVVRVTVSRSPEETSLAYRHDNGIDAYPSLATKLGSKFGAFSQSVMLKADANNVDLPFAQWSAALKDAPTSLIVHPAAYMPRGHDENYPDVLPPDPQWGTTADFAAMVQALHSRGMLVMPYNNPTWWDDKSPTVRAQGVPSIAAIDENGQPIVETYSVHTGHVVSPTAPGVLSRLDAIMAQWRTEVPVDCVFEDQIGSREWIRDFRATEPTPDAYEDSWLVHVARYGSQCLMTEEGWDRLARNETGFNGSLLQRERSDHYASASFGAGNWDPYPLANWMFHDKVAMYQHDLGGESSSRDKEVLSWNMLFGLGLTFIWNRSYDSLHDSWFLFDIAAQRAIASRYMGQPLSSFSEPAPSVMESEFGRVDVVANRSPTVPYAVGDSTIAPLGFLARTTDGAEEAGILTATFHGVPLGPGEHGVVVERSADSVRVTQPLGSDTPLTLPKPGSGTEAVSAYDLKGKLIAVVASSTSGSNITFTYRAIVKGLATGFYRIESAELTPTATPPPHRKKCKKGYKRVHGKCKKKR